MFTYDYAMLAVGRSWKFDLQFSRLAQNFTILKNRHNNAKVHLTTNDDIDDLENLKKYDIDPNCPLYYGKEYEDTSGFNYNLKYLAIKNAFENCKSDFIIYIDSDLQINSEYKEEKLQKFLSVFNEKEYDIASSRLSKGYRAAYSEKYHLIEYDEINEVISFEENFIVLKNSPKLKLFLNKWEELFWNLADRKIIQIHEGLEIGIAAHYAGMKTPDMKFYDEYVYDFVIILKNMFWTVDRPGSISYRF